MGTHIPISHVALWIAAGFILALVLYFFYLGISAWIDTKAAPRKPMMWCDKHGALLEQYMIDFMGQKVCSICFHERLKAAENAGKQ